MSRTLKPSGVTPRAPRPAAGLLLASIHTGASGFLWPGVVEEAGKTDTNLFCFPGGQLNVGDEYERQRNAVYRLVSGEYLDGLVSWASSLGGSVDREAIDTFHESWNDLPLVTMGYAIDGIPAVTIDAAKGMRDLLGHLINVHGFRTIVFLRGPRTHVSANDRFEAYLDSLSEAGIRRRDDLITEPLPWDDGESGICQLLDERGLVPGKDFQAVAAASDLLVFGAVRELQRRGFRIPEDVAAAGFNNTTESQLLSPALTTVAMPFSEQGGAAFRLLLERMKSPGKSGSVNLPTRLVVRESCGCPSPRILLAGNSDQGRQNGPENDVTKILRDISLVLEGETRLSADDLEDLVGAFLLEVGGNPSGDFLGLLHRELESAIHGDRSVACWQDAVSILRRCTLSARDPSDSACVENLSSRARVMISEAVDRSRRLQAYSGAQRDRELSELGKMLLMTFDFRRLGDVLAENLPGLGIRSGYVAVYSDSFDRPDYARLVAGFTEAGRVVDCDSAPVFPVKELVPPQYLPRNRRYSYVVLPLFHQDYQLGYAVLEIEKCDGALYEELRTYISSSLRGAFLFREVEQAREAAEEADRLKSRFLANVSHELRTPLTGILHSVNASLQKDQGGAGAVTQKIRENLYSIQRNAERQLKVTSDLLDLSRAEIEQLHLSPTVLDPRAVLESEFRAGEAAAGTGPDVLWETDLPERLPVLYADPDRFRQILRNLLDNAVRYTRSGRIQLSAAVEPPYLRISIRDSGSGMSRQQQETIFEPFTYADGGPRHDRGTGLGLPLVRRLVALHSGKLDLESRRGEGTMVHVRLPLPSLSGSPMVGTAPPAPVLLLVSDGTDSSPDILRVAEHRGYLVRHIRTGTDWEAVFEGAGPAGLVWDIEHRTAGDWALIRGLRHHPLFYDAPFLLYGWKPQDGGTPESGSGQAAEPRGRLKLLDVVDTACPAPSVGPAIILSVDSGFREYYSGIVEQGLEGFNLSCFMKTEDALQFMMDELPCLLILDLDTFSATGIDTVLRLRRTERFHSVPILIVSDAAVSPDNVTALEDCVRVVLLNHGILSDTETGTLIRSLLYAGKVPAPFIGTLVRRVIGYLNQNFQWSITRWKLAQSVNVSEDYLTRVFRREMGISPWVYLNRYRIHKASQLLRQGDQSIQNIAVQCGFRDQAYFCRVFRTITGMSPLEYRKKASRP